MDDLPQLDAETPGPLMAPLAVAARHPAAALRDLTGWPLLTVHPSVRYSRQGGSAEPGGGSRRRAVNRN